ncbi:MAG: hypothetical protein RLZZ175_1758 [Bacteroidota bacterium]|jgi:peroxiredoxin
MIIKGKLLFLFCLLISTSIFAQNPLLLKGKLTNVTTQKYIYLYRYFGSDVEKIDSAKINKGEFKFKNKIIRGFHKLGFDSKSAAVMVLGNEGEILFTADVKDFAATQKLSGSKENELYKQFLTVNTNYSKLIKQLTQQTSQIEVVANSDSAKYRILLTDLRRREDSANKAQNEFFRTMKTQNNGMFMGKFAGIFYVSDTTNINNYISKEEFSDIEFTTGEMMVGKINAYFGNYVEKTPDAFTQAADKLISKTEANSLSRSLFYRIIINLFTELQLPHASKLRKAYAAEYANDTKAQRYLERLPKAELEIGDLAPDIFLPDTSANFIKLSSLRGKLVLLDFWASWCGPCRRENPNVVKVYEKYKPFGLEILGISLDESKAKWTGAIRKDNLTWMHVSDLRGWSSVAGAAYAVSSIPQTFLIGPDGKILAKNLRGQALEQFLENYFRK